MTPPPSLRILLSLLSLVVLFSLLAQAQPTPVADSTTSSPPVAQAQATLANHAFALRHDVRLPDSHAELRRTAKDGQWSNGQRMARGMPPNAPRRHWDRTMEKRAEPSVMKRWEGV